MTEEAFAAVAKLLPKLSRSELEEARKRACALLGLGGGAKGEEEERADDWLLDALLQELRKQGGFVPPMAVIRRTGGWERYCQCAPHVREWVQRAAPNLERNEYFALMNVLVCCYFRWLDDMPMGATIGPILQFIDKLPGCVERGFPGYVRAGVLGQIARKASRPSLSR